MPGQGLSPEAAAAIKRIQTMEATAYRVEACQERLSQALREASAALADYTALVEYYDSPDWLADVDFSNSPDFPEGVACGVTSEDWIYDLIRRQREYGLAAVQLGHDMLV